MSDSLERSFSQEALDIQETDKDSSSDLKEFGVDVNEPDLFSSENHNSGTEDLLEKSNQDLDEDDLEIPAFLRRQKN